MASSLKDVLFLHPMKTGGTTVGAVLRQCGIQNASRYQHKTLSEIRAIEGKELLDSHFKVMFCRNPYDRAVSFYFFSRKSKISHAHKECIGTDSFHAWVVKYRDVLANLLIPQIEYSHTDNLCLIDYMGRFENFSHSVAQLLESIQIKIPNLHVPHKQRTDMERQHWKEYYDCYSQSVIGSVYSEDFKAYGYS